MKPELGIQFGRSVPRLTASQLASSACERPRLSAIVWAASWRDGGRQVQRGLGLVHSKRHPDGLTRAEAEAALGKLRDRVALERAEQQTVTAQRAADEQRRTLAQVGEALIAANRAGRKPSTIEAYSYWLLIHIVDYFGSTPVGAIHTR